MSYTKQTWATGDTITAEKLNHMEDGIASAVGGYDFVVTSITPTYTVIGPSYDEFAQLYQSKGGIVTAAQYDDESGVYTPIGASLQTDGSIFATNFALRIGNTNRLMGIAPNGAAFVDADTDYAWTYDTATRTYTIESTK